MPSPIPMTPYNLALRFLGMKELPGHVHNPTIVAMCDLVDSGVHDDETPWCSAFVNYCNWLLGCQRSGSLRALVAARRHGDPPRGGAARLRRRDPVAGCERGFGRGDRRAGPRGVFLRL